MKNVYIVFVVVIVSIFFAPTASAHVLVTDTSGKTGAILHIIADDDPIAGEVSSLYFEVQDAVVSEGVQSVQVTITDDKGKTETIAMKVDGSLATAKYTFLLQGRYTLRFDVATTSRSYVYEQVQRVSRGATDGALTQPTYPWSEAALIGCGAVFMVGGIVLWNHRKDVWRNSTLK